MVSVDSPIIVSEKEETKKIYANVSNIRRNLFFGEDSNETIDVFEDSDDSIKDKDFVLSEEKIIKSEDDKDDDIEKVVIKKRKEKHVKEKTEVKKNAKKYCCIYCKKLVSKLMKHFSHIHKEEKDVKKNLTLPPGCPERRQLIDRLRTEGNFKYNTSSDVKENEIILTRVNKYFEPNRSKYLPCSVCHKYLSRLSMRKHFF